VVPLFATGTQQALGATVTFNDVTALAKLDEQHRLVERELETTNEELQSTNEELETINEELQSTNDELEAMNELQGERTGDLDRAHMFLEGILGSLGLGVVVLDADARIQLWNSSAAEFWGLRDHAVVGAHFLTLDIGFPVEALKQPVAAALSPKQDKSELVVEAVNRRGRNFRCRVRTLPLNEDGGEPYGVIVMMSEAE
jgi:two-component system, chemotaxis family, CheB/CheR fusion protein